ncbi:MAG: hypothetical protein ABEJ03_03410 [Candidatus Nanohaloarchaea archaeon]
MERNYLATFVIAASVLIGASPFIVKETSVDTTESTMNVTAHVIDPEVDEDLELGVNADPELSFGRVPSSSNAVSANYTKKITVSVEKRSSVVLRLEGNVSSFVEYPEQHTVTGEESIPVRLTPGEPGYYTGTLEMEIRTPKNAAGRLYLDASQRVKGLL